MILPLQMVRRDKTGSGGFVGVMVWDWGQWIRPLQETGSFFSYCYTKNLLSNICMGEHCAWERFLLYIASGSLWGVRGMNSLPLCCGFEEIVTTVLAVGADLSPSACVAVGHHQKFCSTFILLFLSFHSVSESKRVCKVCSWWIQIILGLIKAEATDWALMGCFFWNSYFCLFSSTCREWK